MRSSKLAVCILVAAAGAAQVRLRADTSAAAAKIAAEIARIERDRAKLGQEGAFIADALGRAQRAIDRSRVYLALDESQEPFTLEAGWRYVAAHRAIKTDGQFAKEWKRIGEPQGPSTATPRVPAVVAAIAASNAVRAPATWRASLPYSQDAGMEAGLYYLGEAQAFAEFSRLCLALPFDTPRAPAPVFKPLADEIARYEAEAAQLYDRADATTRPRFIRVNVALKVAGSLDEERQYGAALYQYLLSRYRGAVAMATDAPAGDLPARLDALRARLADGRDHSIAELFLQRADALIETNDDDATRSAVAIADLVIPTYLRLVAR